MSSNNLSNRRYKNVKPKYRSTTTLGIRVDLEAYQKYKWELTGNQKKDILELMKSMFEYLVNNPNSIDNIHTDNGDKSLRMEITLKHEYGSENDALRIKREIERLNKELTKALSENIQLKQEIEELRKNRVDPRDFEKVKKEKESIQSELERYKYYLALAYVCLLNNDKSCVEPITKYLLKIVDKDKVEEAKQNLRYIINYVLKKESISEQN